MIRSAFMDGWQFGLEGQPLEDVLLPHDALLSQPRTPDSPGGSGGAYFTGGKYVYEKHFFAPEDWKNRHLVLELEAVYRNASVFVNGEQAGGAAYGYIPFFVPLDEYLNYGQENCIRVIADGSCQPDSRWYSGGGIFRPVWLHIGERRFIPPEGVRVTTVSIDPPTISVKTEAEGTVQVEVLDGNRSLARAEGTDVTIPLPGAGLWSEHSPCLYTCRIRLDSGDESTVRFGIRKLSWSNQGFFVNGKETLLRGGCVHHDNGILGAACFDESEFRRVKILKEQGFNAIRSAHNPCSRAMLDACDELGMYVMDESWDMWFHHKTKYDYASCWREYHMQDLAALVSRDYNHPSVILYSIGNEISEPAVPEGVTVSREMADFLHREDPGRAVTAGLNLSIIVSAKKGKGIYDPEEGGRKEDKDSQMSGMNSTMFNFITNVVGSGMNKAANLESTYTAAVPVMDCLDICGYNYASGRYPIEGKRHPERILVGSETFHRDIAKNWEMVKKYPYLIGDFMWTAWDYLGEVGLGTWSWEADGKGFQKPYPWLLADTGALDILGNPTAPMGLARAAWAITGVPEIYVQPVNHPGKKPYKGVWRGSNGIPSWSWQGCDGNKAAVEVYSCGASVELFLNGMSVGRKKIKQRCAAFRIPYAPGVLEAVAYDVSGKELGRSVLRSARKDLTLRAIPEQQCIYLGQLCYIPICICDSAGIVESNGDRPVTIRVENGQLLAFGSANPRTEERFTSGTYGTWYGKALAVVRATAKGTLTLRATAPGLPEWVTEITVR